MTKDALVLFSIGLLGACRGRELSAEEACTRIEPLRDAGWGEEERLVCRVDWGSLPRETRVCATKCLETQSHRFDDCIEDCGAPLVYPASLCTAMVSDAGSADDACIVRLREVKARRPR